MMNAVQSSFENVKSMKKWPMRCFFALSLLTFSFTTVGGDSIQPDENHFQINGFTVYVTRLDRPKPFSYDRPDPGTAYRVKGVGYLKIKEKRLNVRFNVQLLAEGRSSSFIAASGKVSGIPDQDIQYESGDFRIVVSGDGLIITPETATAKVGVIMNPLAFSIEQDELVLCSEKCQIAQDGSVYGRNFLANGLYALKASDYHIILSGRADNIVQLGPTKLAPDNTSLIPDSRTRRGELIISRDTVSSFLIRGRALELENKFQGVLLQGTAKIGSVNSFRFNGTIRPDSQADFLVYLTSPVTKLIEQTSEGYDGYTLTLKTGKLKFRYKANSSKSCNGSFTCDLLFPQSIKDVRSPMEQLSLKDIVLYTQGKGTLSNYVELRDDSSNPYRIEIQNSNLFVSTIEAGAYAYFPNWPGNGSDIYAKKNSCKVLEEILDQGVPEDSNDENNVFQRPGVSIHHGMMYMYSSQINTDELDAPVDADTVKSIIWGALTLTPFGATGAITGSGSSFVPWEQSRKACMMHRDHVNPGWQTILDAEDNIPSAPESRFYLEGLHILEMQLERMQLCMNELESSNFVYQVHFPHPSHINIDFSDSTFTGYEFVRSTGPGPSVSWELPAPTMADSILYHPDIVQSRKPGQEKPNPQAVILWAWRMPITFVQDGIIIDFEKLGSDMDDAITVRIDEQRLDGDEKIFNSEIWIPSLFSDESGVKCGVRFDANFSTEGNFTLLKWDEMPYFGTSHHRSFEASLTNISLVSYQTNPHTRDRDFLWEGKLKLPFFSGEAENSWIPMQFNIKDFIPELEDPIEISETAYLPRACCTDSVGHNCTQNETPESYLKIGIDKMYYSYSRNNFESRSYSAYESIHGDESPLHPGYLEINSYTDARLFPASANKLDSYTISDTTVCGEHVIERLKDYYPNTSTKDLVCYDSAALLARQEEGVSGACCRTFYIGDYEVTSNGKTVLLAEDAKYFPYGIRSLDLSASNFRIYSEESDQEISLNIPGAHLTYSSEGHLIGDFGATMTSMASSLPYEAEFRFRLDPKCGYFYFLGAGSFTYGLRFSGLIFIMHAPYDYLSQSTIGLETSIMEDMRIRSLFVNQDRFKEFMQFNDLRNETVITGAFVAGNASLSIDLELLNLGLALGAGAYFFQFADNNAEPTFRSGLFLNAIGEADLFVLSVKAWLSLTAAAAISTNNSSYIDLLSNSELVLSGELGVEGCVSIVFAHCSASGQVKVEYSTVDGFNFDETSFSAGCGGGGCGD